MQNALERLEFPEIYLGIVAPVGVDTKPTIEAIQQYFDNNDYEVIFIKITDYFKRIKRSLNIDIPLYKTPTDKRIRSYIQFGNRVRELFNDNSILASYAIFQIIEARESRFISTQRISYQKRVYIINQFKRPEELELFRRVYGRIFFQISVYSKKDSRVNYLSHKIAHERNSADQSETRSIASTIIALDENEKTNRFGQRLSKIFHDADVVIDADSIGRDSIKKQVFRFLELLFSSNSLSPTKLEYGMFAAKAAALRTLDLSRQVGAAIFNSTGEIVSMGSNEVPKAGGGTYWSDEEPYDAREYTRGEDSNDARKREILNELYSALDVSVSFDDFVKSDKISESQFMDALEYGRIVHAEMSAISDAARLGRSTRGATLYCTTFPCHMCAKHIVASGIEQVIFLEPYPKSLASDLHPDSIRVEGGARGYFDEYRSVDFVHFHGITPRRYRELFERGGRKRDGKFQEYRDGKKRPFINLIAPFYAELENKVVSAGRHRLKEITEVLKSTPADGGPDKSATPSIPTPPSGS